MAKLLLSVKNSSTTRDFLDSIGVSNTIVDNITGLQFEMNEDELSGTSPLPAPLSGFLVQDGYFVITTQVIGGHGTISPPGPIRIPIGAPISFDLIPDDGYAIGSIISDGQPYAPSTDTWQFIEVTANHSLIVVFTPVVSQSFILNVTVGANGTVDVNPDHFPAYDDTRTITANPNGGYKVDQFIVDGETLADTTTYTFTKIRSDHDVSITFTTI